MGPGTSGGKGEAGQGLVDGWGMGFWFCDIGDDAAHRVRVQGAPGRCTGEVSEEVDESIRLSGPGAFEMCIECMVVAYLPSSTLPSPGRIGLSSSCTTYLASARVSATASELAPSSGG